MTGKKSSRRGTFWGGGDGLLHLIILYACSLLIRDQHGVSLSQAYVGILLGPEIGDVWLGRGGMISKGLSGLMRYSVIFLNLISQEAMVIAL